MATDVPIADMEEVPTRDPKLLSRPSSALYPGSASSRADLPRQTSCETAAKLAKIGMMLRDRQDPEALQFLQRSLHLDPSAATVWKALGHAPGGGGWEDLPLPLENPELEYCIRTD